MATAIVLLVILAAGALVHAVVVYCREQEIAQAERTWGGASLGLWGAWIAEWEAAALREIKGREAM